MIFLNLIALFVSNTRGPNIVFALILFAFVAAFQQPVTAESFDLPQARSWIQEMKTDEKGPFQAIKWFCYDGSITTPQQGCRRGGIQHGEFSQKTEILRNAGYPIANVYAALSEQELYSIARTPKILGAMLIERYLTIVDDGWIFRKARFYRGAFQLEDETRGAARLLQMLHDDPDLASHHYLLLREATRLLYTEGDGTALNQARALATQIANQDRGFARLRNKLHMLPEPEDIERIRNHSVSARGSTRNLANQLATKLEEVFHPVDIYSMAYETVARLRRNPFKSDLQEALANYQNAQGQFDRFWALSDLIYFIRKATPSEYAAMRQELTVLSLHTERALLQLWPTLESNRSVRTRQRRLQMLLPLLEASYGTGLLSERAYQAGAATINELLHSQTLLLGTYYRELRYLTRIPGWASSEMTWEFGPSIQLMREIEPAVDGLVPERLRSTLFSAFAQELDILLKEASEKTGMVHHVAGVRSNLEVRALNQGLARGILTTYNDAIQLPDMASRIIITTETEATIPPVAGILTLNDGNSVSHVQLLARNLGIPNAVINDSVAYQISSLLGKRVVLAVSPAGRVELLPDSPSWNPYFEKNIETSGYLDDGAKRPSLSNEDIIPLKELDASDSGKIVGPKAARVAALKKIFPDKVSNGIVLPFGFYSSVMNETIGDGRGFTNWLREQYSRLNSYQPGTASYETQKRAMLQSVQDVITSAQFSEEFRRKLFATIREELGDPNRVGLFVRSDTNVEDLKGFTGAGLNITEPNVVGFEKILSAIHKVWGSPFQERSFAWRQGRMKHPENVYVSVLLQKTVPVEKSGVIISADLENGDPESFTVAVSRGIGGAVNNEEAEQVIVHRPSSTVRLLSESSGSTMRIADPSGGLRIMPIKQRERILSKKELSTLIDLVDQVDRKYDSLIDSHDDKVPVDIEFGFIDGELRLFQIRPFAESMAAKKNRYLVDLDSELKGRFNEKITLGGTKVQ